MYRPLDAFQPTGKCISVIGSGGKTSFLRYLSKRLPGTVILTTSTHIFPFPEFPLVDVAQMNREQALSAVRSALDSNRIICLGKSEPSGKLADPSPVLPFVDLLKEADHILVEADGSAGRPLKAHRPWEPVGRRLRHRKTGLRSLSLSGSVRLACGNLPGRTRNRRGHRQSTKPGSTGGCLSGQSDQRSAGSGISAKALRPDR